MDTTFADDFFEFGRSGRVWMRDEMLFDGCPVIKIVLPLPNLKITFLNDATALVTYDSVVEYETLQHAHRSSIWSLIGGRWKLRFHQGTPFTPVAACDAKGMGA
jgi:hypothetical protein